jgi:predicted RNA-binding Zn-ribbon protein involved in translation (DUF1610 family)
MIAAARALRLKAAECEARAAVLEQEALDQVLNDPSCPTCGETDLNDMTTMGAARRKLGCPKCGTQFEAGPVGG